MRIEDNHCPVDEGRRVDERDMKISREVRKFMINRFHFVVDIGQSRSLWLGRLGKLSP
jgi:hypothetical protein